MATRVECQLKVWLEKVGKTALKLKTAILSGVYSSPPLNGGRAGAIVWFHFVMTEIFATIYGGGGCNCFARLISASLSSLFCHSCRLWIYMRQCCSMSLIGSMWPGLEMGGRQTVNELGEINTLVFAFVFCVCSAFIILRATMEHWPI